MSFSLGGMGSVVGAVVDTALKVADKALPYVYDMYATGREHSFQNRAQSNAQQFTLSQMQNAHQWEVADLRAAGLNPALSATGGASLGGSPIAATPASHSISSPALDLMSIANAYQDIQNKDQELQNKQITSSILRAQASQVSSDALQKTLQMKAFKAYVDSLGGKGLSELGGRLFGGYGQASKEVSLLGSLIFDAGQAVMNNMTSSAPATPEEKKKKLLEYNRWLKSYAEDRPD